MVNFHRFGGATRLLIPALALSACAGNTLADLTEPERRCRDAREALATLETERPESALRWRSLATAACAEVVLG
jgi:hypothetical protein